MLSRFPWIAKVTKVCAGRKLNVFWMYHTYELQEACNTYRGPWEIVSSNHDDTVDLDSVNGLAAVEENCRDCRRQSHWCWNQTWDVHAGKLVGGVEARKGTTRKRSPSFCSMPLAKRQRKANG